MSFLLVASFSDSLLKFRGSLIEALLNAGLKVHVAAPGLAAGDPVGQRLVAMGVTVHDIPLRRTGMSPLADFGTALALWRVMRLIRPSFVMAYTVKPVVYGMLAAWGAGVPHRFALITGLGYAFQAQKDDGLKRVLLHSVVKMLYTAALRRTNKVFFQNPDDEALFRSLRILAPKASTVVVNGSGVDIVAYQPAPIPETPHFLMIARLLGDKGVREYAEAAKRIRQIYPNIVCSLVGWIDEGPDAIHADELEAWVAAGTLNYLGRRNDVRTAIAACSVYVLPSYREGTPRTVLEAMAMGRPVITTDAPGCRETVIEGQNGYMVPVRSIDGLVQAMQHFICNPSLAVSMGIRSREVAEDKYDVNKVNDSMLRAMNINEL